MPVDTRTTAKISAVSSDLKISTTLTTMSLEQKIDSLIQKFDSLSLELTHKVEQTNATVVDLNEKFSTLIHSVNNVQRQCETNSKKISSIDTKLDSLEQYSRRSNIRIFGIKEAARESTDRIVCDLIKSKMDIDLNLNDVERSHRVGKDNGKPRAILVKFASYRHKASVYGAKKNLKGTGISITEDLTKFRLGVLQEAKKVCGSNKVWTNDGKIFCDYKGKVHRATTFEELPLFKD